MAYVNILEVVYPVGSIYMSTVSTSPASFIGGTWEPLDGRFMYLVSDSSIANTRGGEEKHTLSYGEMPKHRHTDSSRIGWFDNIGNGVPSSYSDSGCNIRIDYATVWSGQAGNDEPHNNMPPYLAVYGWVRTA